jgi:hypothetical protein
MDESTVLTVWPNQSEKAAWATSLQTPDGRSVMTASVRSLAEAQARADQYGYELEVPGDVLAQMTAAGVADPT